MLGKNDLVIKPTSDLFSAVLWSAPKNEPILRSAINAVLKNCGAVPITKATVLNPFNISNFVADKRLILDVRVQDEMKRFYDIEMQTTRHTAFVERMLYSWASVYASQLRSGDEYSEINPVYSIIFSEKSLFRRKRCHLVFEMRERNEYELLMSPFIQMHYLLLAELIKGNWSVLDGVHPELQHWLIFLAFGDKKKEKDMANLVEDDTKVMAAYEEFHRFTADPVMREKILDWDRALVDDYFFGKRAGIRKGFAKGLEKGLAKGLEKGETVGLEKGLAKGLAEGETVGLEKGLAEGLAEGLAKGETVGLEKGLAKGLEKGLAEGLTKGETVGLEKGLAKGLAEGLIKGETVGLEKGLAKGITKGITEGEIKAVLTVLQARFKKFPKRIESAVRHIKDSAVLEALTAQAATCKTLEEFAKSLN